MTSERSDIVFMLYHLPESGCRYLNGNKCSEHNFPDRPEICKDFPIMVHDWTIIYKKSCPAVKDGTFDKFDQKFIALGYRVAEM